MEEKWKKVNPVLPLDYPDPDVIRVDDTYYMVSTTMHFMPGCVILRSYNPVSYTHLVQTRGYEACVFCMPIPLRVC